MKQLERVTLVEYFLYDCRDFVVDGNTGFLGANGAGKTALIDAIQAVMLGVDGHNMHFNARHDAPHNDRSLRDYCLGVCGQGDAACRRGRSNTYIDLVFRDVETGECVTAGVSLTADKASSTHEVRQLYIAPGVALSSADHLRTAGGEDVVMPWREFQFVLKQRCEHAGTVPVQTLNREVFVSKLLVTHLAAAAEVPNSRSFRSVFPQALRLTKDFANLDAMLRTQVIEPRPIDVLGFRQQVSQFKEMRDEITRLKDRLSRAGEVVGRYARVKKALVSKDNLRALAAAFEVEDAGERLGLAEDERVGLEASHAAVQKSLQSLHREIADADEAYAEAISAREANPEYQQQAGHAGRLKDLEHTVGERRATITARLSGLRRAIVLASGNARLAECGVAIEQANAALDRIDRDAASGEDVPGADIQVVAASVLSICTAAERVRAEVEAGEREALKDFDLAKKAAERASRGLPDLPRPTLELQQVLGNLGIRSTPVCDLVSISDPEWQGAIETYLGPHVHALLVDESRELEALDAYRGLQGDRRIYGVKLALPSRLRAWRAPGAGDYAAELIEGEATAVDYLRGELGKLRLAASSEELRRGEKAISKDGMVAKGGGVERMRLLVADAWRIGRRDRAEADKRARKACQVAADALAGSQREALAFKAVYAAFDGFRDAERWPQEIERDWATATDADRKRTRIQRDLAGAASPALQQLRAAVDEATDRVNALRSQQDVMQTRKGETGERLESVRSRIDGLREQAAVAAANEREMKAAKWYDANEVDRLRTEMEAAGVEDGNARRAHIDDAIDKAAAAAAKSQVDGWQRFCEYVKDFDCRNHDIEPGQWERAYKFVTDEQARIQDTEITQYEKAADLALQAAVDSFRHDVASKLLENFEVMREQVAQLNAVLKAAPPFSNNERYQFTARPTDEHRPLYDFLQRIRAHGASEEDFFGSAGEVPQDFEAILADGALFDSPLEDHRRFFVFDVQILQGDTVAGVLSKRFGVSSGGEGRTPLYVIFGAALAAAYGAAANARSGMMLIDEVFDRMDPQNVSSVFQYLNALGLQIVMAGADSSAATINQFLKTYYDVARFGTTVLVTGHKLMDGAWECLDSDDYYRHPEIVDAEVARLRRGPSGAPNAAG